MSTDIKPGQVWKDATGPAHVRVDTVSNNRVGYTWMDDSTSPGLKGSRYVGEFLTDYTPAPSLPTQASDDDGRETAPLDPGAVKAGDVVTVRFVDTGDEISTTAYQPRDLGAGHVYILGWPLNKPGGVHGLALRNFELLDHQPAPEPEPEWKPGTVAVAAVKGRFGPRRVMRLEETPTDKTHHWVEESGVIPDDSHVTDVRPLAVLDPAHVHSKRPGLATILAGHAHGVWAREGLFDSGATNEAIEQILAHLGLDGAR